MTAEDTVSIDSGPKCRICLSIAEGENLINPCKCSGTMGLVHNHCLERWISVKCNTQCELCSSQYAGKKMLKYGVINSIPRYVWARKTQCGLMYCYMKIWLYLYVVLILLRDYKLDTDHLTPSLIFLGFLVASFGGGLCLLFACMVKCYFSWNRWRRCQFKFVLDDLSTECNYGNESEDV